MSEELRAAQQAYLQNHRLQLVCLLLTVRDRGFSLLHFSVKERLSKSLDFSLLADKVSVRRTALRRSPIQVLTHQLVLNFKHRLAHYFQKVNRH